ncbi:hypothetical protein ACHAWF_017695 [Thalassiosira exigua]
MNALNGLSALAAEMPRLPPWDEAARAAAAASLGILPPPPPLAPPPPSMPAAVSSSELEILHAARAEALARDRWLSAAKRRIECQDVFSELRRREQTREEAVDATSREDLARLASALTARELAELLVQAHAWPSVAPPPATAAAAPLALPVDTVASIAGPNIFEYALPRLGLRGRKLSVSPPASGGLFHQREPLFLDEQSNLQLRIAASQAQELAAASGAQVNTHLSPPGAYLQDDQGLGLGTQGSASSALEPAPLTMLPCLETQRGVPALAPGVQFLHEKPSLAEEQVHKRRRLALAQEDMTAGNIQDNTLFAHTSQHKAHSPIDEALLPLAKVLSSSEFNDSALGQEKVGASVGTATSGRVLTLGLPTDARFLSDAHCFLRLACLEIFVASEEEARARGRGARPARAGQAGLRCVHCRHVPRPARANQATCFPSKTKNVFESVRNFQRVHLDACPYVPREVKERYAAYAKVGNAPRCSQGLVRAYYAEAAREVGLVDTSHGLKYCRDADGSMSKEGGLSDEMMRILRAADVDDDNEPSDCKAALQGSKAAPLAQNPEVNHGKFDSVVTPETRLVLDQARKERTAFVLPQDFEAITDYLYLIFHQLEPCQPTSSTLARRKLAPDQLRSNSGLCCRHCRKDDSGINGRYFPLDVASLGNSSFSQMLGSHLAMCPSVPREIKDALIELKDLAREHGSSTKRGAKKSFAEKVWKRMEKNGVDF